MARKVFFCDLHPHFEASTIADCGQLHRLCAQCVYINIFGANENGKSGGSRSNNEKQQIPCPVCQQTIRNVEGYNKEEITKAFLKLGIAEKKHADPEIHLPLPTELHVELMRFLGMESLRKVVAISRLPYALFGEEVRKWNARNVWVYPWGIIDEAKQRKLFEISHRGLSVCKGNVLHVLANVLAKYPFKLAENPAAKANNGTSKTATTAPTAIRRFYFEIRIDQSTGPILFGLVGEKMLDSKMSMKKRLEVERMEAEQLQQQLRGHEQQQEHHQHHRHYSGAVNQHEMARRLAECRLHMAELLAESRWRADFGLRHRQSFLANDIRAWPRNNTWEWEHLSLDYFARQSLVPAIAAGADGRFADGDVLGCGLLQFPKRHLCDVAPHRPMHQQQQLFFTRNGQLFGQPTWLTSDNADDELFPFVGLVNAGTSVTGNFGESDKIPFLYDIGQHDGPIVTG